MLKLLLSFSLGVAVGAIVIGVCREFEFDPDDWDMELIIKDGLAKPQLMA